VQRALQRTVWNSGGCRSYYLDASGRNFAGWPWSLTELRRRLARFDPSDYELTPAVPEPNPEVSWHDSSPTPSAT
jgi:hypothetical protein